MNADQLHGRLEVAVGLVKEHLGVVLRSASLKYRGRKQQISGQARAGYGDAVAAVVRRAHS